MLTLTPKGLYCRAGNFYIDPRGAVEHAVVTHAHSDHARRGSQKYYCTASGEDLLRVRIGKKIVAQSFQYGEKFQLGPCTVSLHSAGHILGSAQVRIEHLGEVWVASGDYKREPDPTCAPFETVPCNVFVTEATFGTPSYSWSKNADLGAEIYEWWQKNAAMEINSVLFAYSLGKAQRVLGVLEPFATKPIYCHSAATPLNDCYRTQGIKLAKTICLSKVSNRERLAGELVLTPRAFLDSPQAQILGDKVATAFASGWMARGPRGFDHGFVMSDHADWNDLVQTITETRAKTVYVQHRGNGALVRHLNNLGVKAFPESALAPANPDQLEFF